MAKSVQVMFAFEEATELHKALETFDGALLAIKNDADAVIAIPLQAAIDLDRVRGPFTSLREALDAVFHKG